MIEIRGDRCLMLLVCREARSLVGESIYFGRSLLNYEKQTSDRSKTEL
ncbi:MAG: hypothetical protein ACK5L1_19440 [Pseudanabaena sp.]